MARAAAVSFLEKGIAVLRMQRGENVVNAEFIDTFHKCLDEVESNKGCRGLITTGEGKFYSNGLAIDWLKQLDRPQLDQFMGDFFEMLARLLVFPMPTVAAVNGHAFAGGCLMALANDCRVMNNERGWMSLNEVNINMRIADSALKYTQQKVPPAVYRNLLVFGKRYTGPEAAASGLVDKAVAASQVEAEAVNLLESVLGKDGFRRDSMGNMKKDVYIEALKDVRGHRS